MARRQGSFRGVVAHPDPRAVLGRGSRAAPISPRRVQRVSLRAYAAISKAIDHDPAATVTPARGGKVGSVFPLTG